MADKKDKSGQLIRSVKLDQDVYEGLKNEAKYQKRSVSSLMNFILWQWFQQRKGQDQAAGQQQNKTKQQVRVGSVQV